MLDHKDLQIFLFVSSAQDPHLHILAVCMESTLVSRLMQFASRMAVRTVTHAHSNVLGVKVSTSSCGWARYSLEGYLHSLFFFSLWYDVNKYAFMKGFEMSHHYNTMLIHDFNPSEVF